MKIFKIIQNLCKLHIIITRLVWPRLSKTNHYALPEQYSFTATRSDLNQKLKLLQLKKNNISTHPLPELKKKCKVIKQFIKRETLSKKATLRHIQNDTGNITRREIQNDCIVKLDKFIFSVTNQT